MQCKKCDISMSVDSQGIASCLSCGTRVDMNSDEYQHSTIDLSKPYNNANLMKRDSTEFRKDDDGKTMFSLLVPEFIEGMAEVLTEGAKKYGIENWKKLSPDERIRYKDSLLRHINSYMKGNMFDKDSHKHEMLHIGCNAMFNYYFDVLNKK